MCFGCISFESAGDIVEKQYDFIEANSEEQLTMSKNNKNVDELSNWIEEHSANVCNLLPFDQWTNDKMSMYFEFQNGFMGMRAQYYASKLLFLYEQWSKQHDLEKYRKYMELNEEKRNKWEETDEKIKKLITLQHEIFMQKIKTDNVKQNVKSSNEEINKGIGSNKKKFVYMCLFVGAIIFGAAFQYVKIM